MRRVALLLCGFGLCGTASASRVRDALLDEAVDALRAEADDEDELDEDAAREALDDALLLPTNGRVARWVGALGPRLVIEGRGDVGDVLAFRTGAGTTWRDGAEWRVMAWLELRPRGRDALTASATLALDDPLTTRPDHPTRRCGSAVGPRARGGELPDRVARALGTLEDQALRALCAGGG